MKMKQILCIVLILCCALSGCSKNTTKDTNATPKGRYMEKTIALPEDIKTTTLSLIKKDNMPYIYCYNAQPFSIVGYQLNQDGKWIEATPAWLKSLTSLPESWNYQPQSFTDGNGYDYLYYTEVVNDYFKGNLLRSKDGKTYETLKPEGWDTIDPTYGPKGGYKAPSKVTVLEDGTLAALYSTGEVTLYDPENYKIKNTISDTRYSESILSSVGNKLILGEVDNNDKMKSLFVYNLENYSHESYLFEASAYYVYCDTNEQNIFLCDSDGIFKLEKDTSVWNCAVDGTLTSLAMPTMWSTGFVCDASNNYYVLYNSDAGSSLMQYSFDATVDTLPSKELRIYALTDNSTLRQAAAVFQQKHPEVKVTITTAMSTEEYASCATATKEDYIRALNTELLADNSYDILVLDGLPTASFIEKGVLTEISDVLKPMLDDGSLLKNINDTYQEDGKQYCVPVRFAINLIMGKSADAKQLTNLNSLEKYIKAHPNTPLFGNLTVEDLANTFLPYQINSLLKEDSKIDREQLIQALNLLKQLSDNCKIVENYDKRSETSVYGVDNMWNISKGDYFCIYPIKGFLDAMYPISLLTYLKGTYTSFDQSFLPSCELGIVSKGKQQELSKEFLLTALSSEVQKYDLYDGFPVNSKALAECSIQDRSGYSACTSIENEDGTESMLYFYALDEQQSKDVVGLCSSVSNKLSAEDHLSAAIQEKAADFFKGNQSVSDAADAIIEKMNVYLSE